MKLRTILNEILTEPDESINFKKRFPTVKKQKITLTKDIEDYLVRWKSEPTNNQPKDKKTIEFWSKQPTIPPIILADYGRGYVIIDGRHRAYANFIVNKKPTIDAYIEPKFQ